MSDIKKIGLIYNKEVLGDDTSWMFDHYSAETWGSSWHDFGYEIIFRFEAIRAPERIIDELKATFKMPYRLPDENFRFDFTFWYVYYDKLDLRASMIQSCEHGVDKVAKKNNIAVISNGFIIQPRPAGYLKNEIEINK
jgi:hypothetical protein